MSIALLTIFDKIISRSTKVLYKYSISNRYNLENQRIKYTSSSDVYTPHDTNTKSPILFSHLLSLTRNCTQGRTVHTLSGSTLADKSFSSSSNRIYVQYETLFYERSSFTFTYTFFVLSSRVHASVRSIFLSRRHTNGIAKGDTSLVISGSHTTFQAIFLRLIVWIYSYCLFGKCSIKE